MDTSRTRVTREQLPGRSETTPQRHTAQNRGRRWLLSGAGEAGKEEEG